MSYNPPAAALFKKGAHHLRILVVEDEEVLAQALVEVLKEEFYAVDFAGDGETALELARSRSAHQELQLRRERARIGQQLQDNVLQRIFSAGLRLEALQGSAEDPVVQDRLREVTADLDATIREIRAVLTAG